MEQGLRRCVASCGVPGNGSTHSSSLRSPPSMDADAVRVKLSWTQRDHLPRISPRFVRFWTLREETSSSSKKSSSCESCESSPFSHAYCLIEAFRRTNACPCLPVCCLLPGSDIDSRLSSTSDRDGSSLLKIEKIVLLFLNTDITSKRGDVRVEDSLVF